MYSVCVCVCVCVARFLSRSDTVTVSVWNNRKVHKKEGAGFLGCVRLTPPTITRMKDTGCEEEYHTCNTTLTDLCLCVCVCVCVCV